MIFRTRHTYSTTPKFRWLCFLVCGIVLPAFMAVSSAHAVGLPSRYSAEAIEARVIDAETKKPLEGVIVVAHWQLFYSTVGGRVPAGQLEVMETLTDRNGRFYFPAWGPKKVPKYKQQKGDIWIAYIPFLAPDGYLDDSDPALLLFKPGYEYVGLQNPMRSHTDHSPVRRSVWNGKTITLKPFKRTAEEYAEHVYRLSGDMDSMLDFARGDKDCNWKKTPRMLVALHKMSVHFEKQGIKLPGWRIGQRIHKLEDIPSDPRCDSVEEFFEEYMP